MTRNPNTPSAAAEALKEKLSGPWWRNPYCWLILVGPLTVIVAGFVTMWIAVSGADTVVENYYQKGIALSQKNAQEPASLLPAKQARNHAATGGSPAASK